MAEYFFSETFCWIDILGNDLISDRLIHLIGLIASPPVYLKGMDKLLFG